MNFKLIASAIGLFGGGMLVGWALTADHYDRKLKDFDARLDFLRDKLADVETSVDAKTFSSTLESTEGPIAFTWGVDDPDQPELDLHIVEMEKAPVGVVDDDPVVYESIEDAENAVLREQLQRQIDAYVSPENIRHSIYDANETVVPDKTPPFVISKAAYAYDEEGDGFDKITLTYYPGNRVLLDEDGDPIDDIQGMVGMKNMAHFGDRSEDPDTVFIRNRRLLTDFEVVKEEVAPLPIWVKYGMGQEEFQVARASGLLRVRDEDL